MDAHVKAYYDDLEAYHCEIEAQAMKAAEDHWLDNGCQWLDNFTGFDD